MRLQHGAIIAAANTVVSYPFTVGKTGLGELKKIITEII